MALRERAQDDILNYCPIRHPNLRQWRVATDDNYSDFLTKPMSNVTTFLKFRALVMGEPAHA